MRPNPPIIPHVSLCTGYDGIGLGLGRVVPNLVTIGYCEREIYAVSNLVAKMEAGLLDAAPVFPCVSAFPWLDYAPVMARGILSFGWPCQPVSCAGKRKATEDERWLFDIIADGIVHMRPGVIFAENVEGLLSAKMPDGSSVFGHCISRLEALHYKIAAGLFSASEVGAPHQRKRVFILGVADDLGERGQELCRQIAAWAELGPARDDGGDGELADSGGGGRREGSMPRSIRKGGPAFAGNADAWPSRPGEPQHAWEPPRVVADANLAREHQQRGVVGEVRGRLEHGCESMGNSACGNSGFDADGGGESSKRRGDLGSTSEDVGDSAFGQDDRRESRDLGEASGEGRCGDDAARCSGEGMGDPSSRGCGERGDAPRPECGGHPDSADEAVRVLIEAGCEVTPCPDQPMRWHVSGYNTCSSLDGLRELAEDAMADARLPVVLGRSSDADGQSGQRPPEGAVGGGDELESRQAFASLGGDFNELPAWVGLSELSEECDRKLANLCEDAFMIEKTCHHCSRSLPVSFFYKNASKADGLSSQCKVCHKETVGDRNGYLRDYREKNQGELLQKGREYYQRNRESIRVAQRLAFHRDKCDPAHFQARRANWQKYYDANKPEILVKLKQNRKARRAEGRPEDRIKDSLRWRLRSSINGGRKSAATMELLGCSIAELKQHLEGLFWPGMEWSNYGEWHIDHIRPCAAYDLLDPVQQRECFHFTNLQPLWAKHNIAKGAKILSAEELAEIHHWMVASDNRTDELRLLGNGCIPATVALAFRTLLGELCER